MSRAFRHTILAFLIAVGCADSHREPRPHDAPAGLSSADTAFRPGAFAGGEPVTRRLQADLDGDGKSEEIVVTIGRRDGAPTNAIGDRAAVVTWHAPSRRWEVVDRDSALWISAIEVKDVTGDKLPDILLWRKSGGNDPVAAEGLAIISADGGRVRCVLSLRHGAPEIVDSAHGRAVIAVYDRLWPPMVPHAESTPMLKDLFAYAEARFRPDTSLERARFHRLAAESSAAYRRIRRTCIADTVRFSDSALAIAREPLPVSSLFSPAALSLLYDRRSGRNKEADAFWSKEREFLRARMPAEQFAALDSIAMRSLTLKTNELEGLQ